MEMDPQWIIHVLQNKQLKIMVENRSKIPIRLSKQMYVRIRVGVPDRIILFYENQSTH